MLFLQSQLDVVRGLQPPAPRLRSSAPPGSHESSSALVDRRALPRCRSLAYRWKMPWECHRNLPGLVNVNTKNYGKIHHFSWVNSLFQWPLSIAMLNYQRVCFFSLVYTDWIIDHWWFTIDLPWKLVKECHLHHPPVIIFIGGIRNSKIYGLWHCFTHIYMMTNVMLYGIHLWYLWTMG